MISKKDISSDGMKLFQFNFIVVYLSPLNMLMLSVRSYILHFSVLHRWFVSWSYLVLGETFDSNLH